MCYYAHVMTSRATAEYTPPEQYTFLDTRGLNCPEPVMMLHAEVRKQAPRSVIRVVATDPSTQRDIPKFCRFLGHELLAEGVRDDEYEYWIKISAS